MFPWIPFSKHDRCASMSPARRSPSRPQGPQTFGGICWLGVSNVHLVSPTFINGLKGFLDPRLCRISSKEYPSNWRPEELMTCRWRKKLLWDADSDIRTSGGFSWLYTLVYERLTQNNPRTLEIVCRLLQHVRFLIFWLVFKAGPSQFLSAHWHKFLRVNVQAWGKSTLTCEHFSWMTVLLDVAGSQVVAASRKNNCRCPFSSKRSRRGPIQS